MRYIFSVITLIFLSISGSGCGQIEARKIEKEIEDELSKGDPKKKILAFMESRGWEYTFDEYGSRYQARKPREGGERRYWGINFFLYVDEEMRFEEAEVVTMYTFL